ncbi:MAG TPA: MBL fold metallo-hydrolase [Thermoleophilaceae bacterium]|jgi:phosphoribosyl 1,2-cyclic phosphodiesterase
MSMRVRYWGARGSIPTPRAEMAAHGGNTACVELTLSDGSEVILDAGTGISDLGRARERGAKPVHLLLTHLHLDHIQGLMFFSPLFDPSCDVRVSGPVAFGGSLLSRLARYISAPLAPIEIRELPASVSFEDIPTGTFQLGPATVEAGFVNHRGPTLGFRITDGDTTVAYIPDHEPALGQHLDRSATQWISGFDLARGADLLIHDSQYTEEEYAGRVGWGHSTIPHTIAFARRCGVRRLALFHHDPLHDDAMLDSMTDGARAIADGAFEEVVSAREGDSVEL